MTRRTVGMLLAVLVVAMTGCAPALQSNRADLDARVRKIRNVVMLPPDTKICELSAGGVSEQRDDWCATGRRNVEKAIIENLSRWNVNVKVLQVTADLQGEVEDIKDLYEAVKDSMYTHAYYWQGQNPNFFPDRLKNFDYSVGSLEKLLRKHKADGLLLVHAEDEISSSGRKALRVVQAINPFSTAQRSGMTEIEIALTDRKGDILWNYYVYDSGGYDLRDLESTRGFVKELLGEFPREGK